MATRWNGVLRIIDANLNRAREAARVAEEYARFVVDSPRFSRRLKEVRHRVHELAAMVVSEPGRLLSARDTPGDVGTSISLPESEGQRGTAADVLAASLKRLQEALRVIEEYAKTLSRADAAKAAQMLRYEVYAVESGLLCSPESRLAGVRLCVIVTSGLCRGRDPAEVALSAIRGGAGMIQLREKGLGDAEFLALARRLRAVTAEERAVFIVNDRADIAAASDADGVHLGQGDLACVEARKLLGAGAVIGVSTHAVAEAERAAADGADYIGVGPVFTTQTKAVERLAGLEYVRAVSSAQITIPFYAIGGITAETVKAVLDAGAKRVAVCSAVISADDVEAAARQIGICLTG